MSPGRPSVNPTSMELTVNKADLVKALEARLGSRKAASDALEAVLDIIIREVTKGQKVGITGFGTFDRVERAARTGRNPRTGAAVKIAKSKGPRFRPGTAFKGFVKSPSTLPKAASTGVRAAAGTKTPVAAKAAPAKAAAKKAAPAKAAPAKAAAKPAVKKAAPAKAAPAKAAAKKASAKAAPAKAAAKPVVKKAAPAKAAPAKAAPAKAAAKKAPAKAAPAKAAPAKKK